MEAEVSFITDVLNPDYVPQECLDLLAVNLVYVRPLKINCMS